MSNRAAGAGELAGRTQLAKVWWPNNTATAGSGYLVGWSSNGFSCLVVGVVTGRPLELIEHGLDEVAQDAGLDDMRQQCSGTLMVLGEWSTSQRANHFHDESSERRMRRRSADIWLRMSRSRGSSAAEHDRPMLREVYCCGVSYRPAYHIVLFDPQEQGHLLTTKLSFPRILAQPAMVCDSRKPSKLKCHGGGEALPPTETDIKVRQVNCCEQMSRRLQEAMAKRAIANPLVAAGSSGSLGKSVDSAPDAAVPSLQAGSAAGDDHHTALLSGGVRVALLGMRYICEGLLPILEYPLPIRGGGRLAKQWRRDGGATTVRLIDLSVLAHQSHFKMRQFCLMLFGPERLFSMAAHCPNPSEIGGPNVRLESIRDSSIRHSYTIAMRNAAYVGMVDTVLGLFFIVLLVVQEPHVMRAIEGVHTTIRFYYVDVLREYVDWLIDEPAGFKLNKNLNRFIGAFFVDCIDVWNRLHIYFPHIDRVLLSFFTLSGINGISCLFALAADILFFETLHIYAFYTAMGAAYKTMLRVLQSLALLFQGRKWNTLRSRADTCEFELDQLLLGVLLFALHFFLFPNIFGFYIFFALVWAHVALMQLGISLCFVFVNHFPFYAIALLLTDSRRVVGGTSFRVLWKDTVPSPRKGGQSSSASSTSTSISATRAAAAAAAAATTALSEGGGDPVFTAGAVTTVASHPVSGGARESDSASFSAAQIASDDDDDAVAASVAVQQHRQLGGSNSGGGGSSQSATAGLYHGMSRGGHGRDMRGEVAGSMGLSPRIVVGGQRPSAHMELHAHPASIGEICAEFTSCVVELLSGYAPAAVLRKILRGQHLQCPNFIQVWTATSVPPTIAQFSETLNAAFGIMPPKACSSSSQLGQLELQPEPVPEPELQYALSVHQQDAEHTAEGHTGRHAHAQSLELGPELEQEPVVIATSETVLLAEAAQQAEAKRVLEAVTTMKELLHSQDFDAISHALDTFEQAFPSQSGPHQAEFAGVCSSLQLHWEQCLDRAKETCLRLSHSDDPREILSGLQQYEVYKETIAVERAALLARYAELTHGQAKAEQPADAGGSPAASSNPVVVTGPAITC